MPVNTYDASQVNVLVAGVPILDEAEGEFLSIDRSTDAYTKTVGTRGSVARSKSTDKSGEIVITLKQTSPTNAVFTALAVAGELNDDDIVPVLITDKSGASVHFGGECWIRKQPAAAYGAEITNREWIFDVASLEHGNAGNA
jgi:hypothetical protein